MASDIKTVICAAILLTQWLYAEGFWLRPDVGYHNYRKRFVLPLSNDLFKTVYHIDRLATDIVNTVNTSAPILGVAQVYYSELLCVANVHGVLLGSRIKNVLSWDDPESSCIEIFGLSVTQSQLVAESVISVPVLAPHKGVKPFSHSPNSLYPPYGGLIRTTRNGIEILLCGGYSGFLRRPSVASTLLMRGGGEGYYYPFYGTVEVQTNGSIMSPWKIRQYWQQPSGQSPRLDMDRWESRFMSLVEMPTGGMDFGILSCSDMRDSIELINFNSSGEMVNVSSVLAKPVTKKQRYILTDTYVCRVSSNDLLYLNMPEIKPVASEAPFHNFNSLVTNSFGTSGMTFYNVNSVFPISFTPSDYQFRDGRCFLVGIDSKFPVFCSVQLVDRKLRVKATIIPATSTQWGDFMIVPGRETNCVLVLERMTSSIWRTALRHSYP